MLGRRTTTTAPSMRTRQTQVAAIDRVREGDKAQISRIVNAGGLERFGIIMKPTQEQINTYSADQLYEIMYGGALDYWRSPVFSTLRRKETTFVDDLIREINVVESIYNCPACNYDRISLTQEQIGGGDESMTTKYLCTKCGHRWSNSGRG